MFTYLRTGLVLPVAIAALSCAEPPTQEVEMAKAALDGAVEAEADQYAETSYQTAKDTLDAALMQIAQQESRWIKNYDSARLSLKTARELAQKAAFDSETNKATIRKETLAMVSEVEQALSEARTSLALAPKGKGADEDLLRLGSIINQVESQLSSTRYELDAGHLKVAHEQVNIAQTQMVQVQGEVAVALQKVELLKKKRRG